MNVLSRVVLVASMGVCTAMPVRADPPGSAFAVVMAPGSQAVEHTCLPPCACPTGEFTGTLLGRFTMGPRVVTPFFDHYPVIASLHSYVRSRDLVLIGTGEYTIGGDFALSQRLQLTLRIGNVAVPFDSGLVPFTGGPFPRFRITVSNDTTVPCTGYDLHIIAAPICLVDFDDGSGTGTPDGGVTVDDLLYYLQLFTRGLIPADLDDGSGMGHPDGGVTIDDLLYFLARFDAGC